MCSLSIEQRVARGGTTREPVGRGLLDPGRDASIGCWLQPNQVELFQMRREPARAVAVAFGRLQVRAALRSEALPSGTPMSRPGFSMGQTTGTRPQRPACSFVTYAGKAPGIVRSSRRLGSVPYSLSR